MDSARAGSGCPCPGSDFYAPVATIQRGRIGLMVVADMPSPDGTRTGRLAAGFLRFLTAFLVALGEQDLLQPARGGLALNLHAHELAALIAEVSLAEEIRRVGDRGWGATRRRVPPRLGRISGLGSL